MGIFLLIFHYIPDLKVHTPLNYKTLVILSLLIHCLYLDGIHFNCFLTSFKGIYCYFSINVQNKNVCTISHFFYYFEALKDSNSYLEILSQYIIYRKRDFIAIALTTRRMYYHHRFILLKKRCEKYSQTKNF